MANNITLVIQAKDNATKVLYNVSKSLNNLSAGNASASINSLNTSIMGLAGAANPLLALIATTTQVIGAFNDLAVAGAQFDRLEAGASSLGRQYGMTSQDIINAVDKITQGTLSQSSILQQANQAMLLGVAHSEEELTTLAAIAADRGRKMGISMEKAFSSIVLGVGRLSPLILDNLGIILDADVTYAKYAKTIGKTADSLTDMEKRQALLNRLKDEMKSVGEVPMDDKTSWEKLAASIDNATASLGTWINEYLKFNKVVDATADAIEGFSDNLNDTMLVGVEGSKKRIEELTIEYHKFQGELIAIQRLIATSDPNDFIDIRASESISEGMPPESFLVSQLEAEKKLREDMKGILSELTRLEYDISTMTAVNQKQEEMRYYAKIKTLEVAIKEEEENQANILLQERWNKLVSEYATLKNVSKHEAELLAQALFDGQEITDDLVRSFGALVGRLTEAEKKAKDMQNAIEGIQGGVRNAAIQAYIATGFNEDVLNLYQAQKMELQGATAELQVMGYSEDELAFKVAKVQDEHTSVFEEISNSVKETEKLKNVTTKVTEEYTKLEGIVGGIVGGLYEDIGGVKVEDFLPYEDAPNEAARRIADVMVKGFDSPWASYFKDSFPELFTKYSDLAGGDVKKAAGLLLKDFQSGLVPELIDKEKVKDLAKRMFMADQASKAMVDEIAKDLAKELNISIEEATGAVSSAAGVKKPLSGDEIKKIISETKLTPTFDLSSSKRDFEQAAKTSGFADQNGKVFVNVTAMINEIKKSDELPASAFTITTGLKFPEEDVIQLALNIHYPSLYLNTNLKITKENLDGFTAILNSLMETNPALIYTKFQLSNMADFVYQTQTLLNMHKVTLPIDFLSATAEQFSTMLAPFADQLKSSFEGEGGIAVSVAKALEDSMMNNQDILEFQGIMFAAHFFNGFSNSGVGRSLAFELNRQLSESESLIEVSGKTFGGKWGQSFLEIVGRDVPFELLKILVDLVTPEVKKRVAEEKTRQ